MAIKVGEHRTFRWAEARNFGVGGITEQAENTLFAVVRQTRHIEMFAINGGVIKLEITRKNDRPNRGFNRQGIAIRHRVGVADELDGEVLTHLHHVAWADGLQLGAIRDARLFHLAGEHRQSQSRPVDHRDVEVLEVVRNTADVIFMPMGHDHSPDPLLVLAQEAGIRQNNIHTMHPIAGEGEAGIDQHQVIAVLEHTGVLSDLVQTAEGNHPETRLLTFRGSRTVRHEKEGKSTFGDVRLSL